MLITANDMQISAYGGNVISYALIGVHYCRQKVTWTSSCRPWTTQPSVTRLNS